MRNVRLSRLFSCAVIGSLAAYAQTYSANINVGNNPTAVSANSATNKIYVANYGSNNVTVIDGLTNSTTNVSGIPNPTWIAVNPNTNKIYVLSLPTTNFSNGSVAVVDGASNTVVATIPVGSNPSHIAVNAATNKIYVANYVGNTVTVIDGNSNTTTTVGVGSNPYHVAVNAQTNKVYVTNLGSSNVTVIDGATNATSTVSTGSLPLWVSVNQTTNKIYVANEGSASVTVIDGASNATSTVATGSQPQRLAINETTNKIYVANSGSSSVTVIDGATNGSTTVSGGVAPTWIAVNPTTNKIYVGNYYSSNNSSAPANDVVTIIDGATNSTSTATVGSFVSDVTTNPSTNEVYVANSGNGSVTAVIDNPPSCGASFSPGSASTGANGASGAATLNIGSNCTWVPGTDSWWLSVPGVTYSRGTGTVNYTQFTNVQTTARSGNVVANNAALSITQAGSTQNFATRQVTLLYQSFLSREPDQGGLNYWVNQPANQLGAAFYISQEFQQVQLNLVQLYRAILGRQPDYNNEYLSGVRSLRIGANTVSSLAAQIVAKSGIGSTSQLISAMCANVNPGAQSAISACISANSNLTSLTPAAAAVQFISSNSYQGQFSSQGDAVYLMYTITLNRPPDSSGFNYWLNTMISNNYNNLWLVQAFVISTEFQNRLK